MFAFFGGLLISALEHLVYVALNLHSDLDVDEYTFEKTSDAFLVANLACSLSGSHPHQEHWLTSQILPYIAIL